jgi:hypothetical protein
LSSWWSLWDARNCSLLLFNINAAVYQKMSPGQCSYRNSICAKNLLNCTVVYFVLVMFAQCLYRQHTVCSILLARWTNKLCKMPIKVCIPFTEVTDFILTCSGMTKEKGTRTES